MMLTALISGAACWVYVFLAALHAHFLASEGEQPNLDQWGIAAFWPVTAPAQLAIRMGRVLAAQERKPKLPRAQSVSKRLNSKRN